MQILVTIQDDVPGPMGEPRQYVYPLALVVPLVEHARKLARAGLVGDQAAQAQFSALATQSRQLHAPNRGETLLAYALVNMVLEQVRAELQAETAKAAAPIEAPKPAQPEQPQGCPNEKLPESDPKWHPVGFPCDLCQAQHAARRAAKQPAAEQPAAQGGG